MKSCQRCGKETKTDYLTMTSAVKETKVWLCADCFSFIRKLFIMFMESNG